MERYQLGVRQMGIPELEPKLIVWLDSIPEIL